jgi:hypothetical protein
MDSERRHELQENTLSVELSQIAAWLRKHGFKLLVGVLLVVLIVTFAIMYFRNQAEKEARLSYELSMWALGAGTELPDQTKQQLTSGDGPQAALATFLLGRDQMMLSYQAATPVEAMDARKLAAGHFQTVIDRFGNVPVLVARARRGLAVIAEEQDEPHKALEQYEAITKIDALNDGYPIFALALRRKRELSRALESGTARVELASVTPQRNRAELRAARMMLQAGQEEPDYEQLGSHLASEGDVEAQIRKLHPKIRRIVRVDDSGRTRPDPGISDSHVVGSQGLMLSRPIAGQTEDDPSEAVLIRLKRTQGDKWVVTGLELHPADKAEEIFDDFLEQQA